jgi:hypothetical protein
VNWRYDRDELPGGGFEICRIDDLGMAEEVIGILKTEADARLVENLPQLLHWLEIAEPIVADAAKADARCDEFVHGIRKVIAACRRRG